MNSRKLTNFLLFALLIILVGFLSYYLFVMRDNSWGDSSKNASSTAATSTATSTSQSSISSSTPPQISSTKITDHNAADNYAIDITYPQISSFANADAEASINANISTLVQGEVSSFKESLPSPAPASAPAPISSSSSSDDASSTDSDQSTLQMTFTSATPSLFPNIQSFTINESSYDSGAAHSSQSVFALNYSLSDGSLISLSNIFASGSNYLSLISNYTKSNLETQLSAGGNVADEDMINSGAGPTASNFSQFLITDDGLEIIFNEYQVADYAAGQPEVTIPWSVLKPALDPNGPVKI